MTLPVLPSSSFTTDNPSSAAATALPIFARSIPSMRKRIFALPPSPAVHRDLHYAARTRRQAALRRSPHRHLPEFPAYGKAITIRNLLNHTSGLPDYEDILEKKHPNTPDEKIPQILDAGVLKLLEQQTSGKFAPGSKWEYSNSGYAVLAMIVEKVSGKSFGQFLHERIFTPLKMTNTLAYEKGKNEVPHRAYGYSKLDGAWRETDQSSTSAVLGDGGIYSSLDDLAKWDRALRDHTLLSEAEMRPALTPVRPTGGATKPEGKPVSYGFGWFLDPYRGHKRMWHYGETVGFRTVIQRFPDDQLTVIVLANRADVDPQALALKVADLYLRNP